VRDASQEEQGRDILAGDAHAEVQADLRAVARLERSDQFASPDGVAFGQRRANRLVARHDPSRM
jgi:hypothetical protein